MPSWRSAGRLSSAATLVLLALAAVSTASADPPTAPQRAWALAATAMLFERNGDRHDILAGSPLTPGDVQRVKRLLEDWWGVRDHDTLVRSLRWLETAGHRVPFATMGARLATQTDAERVAMAALRRVDFSLNQKMGVVELHYARLGAAGLLGWDFARFLALCRWGYAAGYVTEDEAWERMMPAARLLRQAFTSWRELGENYLIGRQFWDPEEHVRSGQFYRKAFDRLLSSPESPWILVPWAVDLGPPSGMRP